MGQDVGDFDGNRKKILEARERAIAGSSDLVIYPELCVTGYPPEDLVLKPGFVAGDTSQWNPELVENTSLFEIEKYDFTTGEVSTAVSGSGGATRPTPSPDGKKIAFVRRERGQSKLYVKDIESGQLSKIYDALDPDQRRLFTLANILPRSLAQQLQRWVEGGQYAQVFDHVEDTVTLAPFQTIDFEGLDGVPLVLEPPPPQAARGSTAPRASRPVGRAPAS